MLKTSGDWVPLGNADEQKPAKEGTVEAWARSADNPVGGWYGLKKGLRGRFGNYVPPVLEVLGSAEAEHHPRNNRMRALEARLRSPTSGMTRRLAGFQPTSRSHQEEAATMGDPKSNTDTVRAYYELAFNEGKPEEAVTAYLGDRYTQHNPQAADGPDAFIGFVRWYRGEFPQLNVEIKRTVAEGDLVVTHSLITTSPEDRGTAAVDIFRLEDGKIVEHWDVLQPVPETAENDNTMF